MEGRTGVNSWYACAGYVRVLQVPDRVGSGGASWREASVKMSRGLASSKLRDASCRPADAGGNAVACILIAGVGGFDEFRPAWQLAVWDAQREAGGRRDAWRAGAGEASDLEQSRGRARDGVQ